MKKQSIIKVLSAVLIIAMTLTMFVACKKKQGPQGEQGVPGKDGVDGVTPTIEISEDGYWVINGTKTEYKAIGVDGIPGIDGDDGAPGENGIDGETPTVEISEDGYWVINGTKTEYKAIGVDGTPGIDGDDGAPGENGIDGVTPTIEISDDGYWVINGVKTEYLATVLCNHIWQTETTAPTCTTEGYDTVFCPLCDKSAQVNKTEKLEHTYATNYTTDADYHWFKCTGCDASKDKDFHTLDDDGICTVCGVPISATPGVVYDVSADGTYAEVIGYEGTATKVKIASEYNGLPIKNIYSDAFKANRNITSVIIPDSVITIGDSAFRECKSLDAIIIPDSVTSIGKCAFYYCTSLKSVIIGDSVTSIGERAFDNCTSLTSINIGDSLTKIGYDAFYACNAALYTEYNYGKYVGDSSNPYAILVDLVDSARSTYEIHENTRIIGHAVFRECSRLTSITIPDSVVGISDYAFYDCASLKSVTIGNSVTSIGENAFCSCDSLTNVTVGDSVTNIGVSAFSNCDALTSVTIGSGVTSIGRAAFNSCHSLASINFEGTVEQWNAISFGDYWSTGSLATEVICSDGVVTL